MTDVLDADGVAQGLRRLAPDWSGDTVALIRTVEFADFMTAVSFIDQIAPVCEQLAHHPDLRLTWRSVEITLRTHSAGGVTAKDLELAETVDAVVAGLPLA